MGWAACTIADMTEDGGTGDLVLNEGAPSGTCEHTAGVDCDPLYGCVSSYVIECPFEVEANPPDTGVAEAKIEISLSDDDITYTDWAPFRPGTFYCRYFKLKATIYGDPAKDVRPKITRFDPTSAPANTEPTWPGIESVINAVPANPRTGSNYLVGLAPAGQLVGHENERVYIADSTGPTYGLVFFHPVEGQRVYNKATDEEIFYEGTEWVRSDPRKQFGTSVHRHAQGYNAVNGTWNYSIDANQDSNGYEETFSGGLGANGDYIEFKFGLLIGDYTLVAIMRTGPSFGIVDVSLDGVVIASWDLFTPGITRNLRQVITPISVTGAITHTLRFTMNGQNPLSAGFDQALSWFEIFPI